MYKEFEKVYIRKENKMSIEVLLWINTACNIYLAVSLGLLVLVIYKACNKINEEDK